MKKACHLSKNRCKGTFNSYCKVIDKNIRGGVHFRSLKEFSDFIINNGTYKNIAKTKYVDDKAITDHYAIIPTGRDLLTLAP